jgi:polysaccharide export outer membrane protein
MNFIQALPKKAGTLAAGSFAVLMICGQAAAQAPQSPKALAKAPASAEPAAIVAPARAITPPDDYVIGPDDALSVQFWREKEMSLDVAVRPDGKITLPLINDVDAAGLTPEQLRTKITTEAARFVEDPSVTVLIKQINSRRVFITGQVAKPGPYNLTAPTTVIQLIAIAGGLNDFAHRKDIVIMRMDSGQQVTFPFDYAAVVKRTKLQQNIVLKPGDTVVVP